MIAIIVGILSLLFLGFEFVLIPLCFMVVMGLFNVHIGFVACVAVWIIVRVIIGLLN